MWLTHHRSILLQHQLLLLLNKWTIRVRGRCILKLLLRTLLLHLMKLLHHFEWLRKLFGVMTGSKRVWIDAIGVQASEVSLNLLAWSIMKNLLPNGLRIQSQSRRSSFFMTSWRCLLIASKVKIIFITQNLGLEVLLRLLLA